MLWWEVGVQADTADVRGLEEEEKGTPAYWYPVYSGLGLPGLHQDGSSVGALTEYNFETRKLFLFRIVKRRGGGRVWA